MEEADGMAPRGRQSGPPPPPRERPQTRAPCSNSAGRTRPQLRLHNFSFPSTSWGSHRLLRCVKSEPRGRFPSADPGSAAAEEDPRKRRRRTAPPSVGGRRGVEEPGEGGEGEDERLVKFRDSVMAEFQEAIQRIPLPSSVGGPPAECGDMKERCGLASSAAGAAEAARPWNLRLRRAACTAPVAAAEDGSQKAQNNRNHCPAPQENNKKKNSEAEKRTDQAARSEVGAERKERAKFSSVLSMDEIAEDFLAMTGCKPSRRPKKRLRKVQRKIEMLYPGFYLCEVTPDLYRNAEDK